MTAARSFLFDFYLAALTLIMGLALAPALIDRRAARAVTRSWAQCALAGLHAICGIRHEVKGEEFIPKGPAIIASNHQSMWETIMLLTLLERPAMVFKKELKRIPVYGWWASRTGVPVDRRAGAKALRALRRETERHVARGDQIVVFPEGTRNAPGSPGPLQPGVVGMYLVGGAPVTPVVHNSGEAWRHPDGLKSPGLVTIRFLPAIPPGLSKRAFLPSLEAALREDPQGGAA